MLKHKYSGAMGVLLLASVLCLVTIASAQADSPTNHIPSAGLVVLPEPQLSLTDRNQADYAIGPVSFLDTAQIEHNFTLRNEGNDPLTIMQFQPSCHCTAVTVEKIVGRIPTRAEAADPTLLPGEEVVIKVTVQLARQSAGPLTQGVFIFAVGHDGPVARLHLNAILTTGITVSPASLDFGAMKPGESQSRIITITFDDRLVAGGALPAIAFQNGPQTGAASHPIITIAPEPESAPTDFGMRVQSYAVTMRPAHAGDVSAHLFFSPLDASKYHGIVPYDAAMDVFRKLAVSVCARVTPK